MQDRWRTWPILSSRSLLQPVMQRNPVDEMPRVLPAEVRHRQVLVQDGFSVVVKLEPAVQQSAAKLLGKDAPSPQDAVPVGGEMNTGAQLGGETRLFVKLIRLYTSRMVATGKDCLHQLGGLGVGVQ